MKKILLTIAFALSAILVGCNQLTQYTVSEQQINQALAKHNAFTKEIGLSGIANAHITLDHLQSEIGRETPNKVTLSGIANIDISSFLGSQKATVNLKMQAQPVFDREKGAIYLRDLEFTNAQIEPEKMRTVLDTVMPYLNQALRSYFNQYPAYVLSEENSKAEALAKKLAKGIEVRPGEIVIPFTQ